MDLITCPGCGNSVSEATPACLTCSRPITGSYAPAPSEASSGLAATAQERVFFNRKGVRVTNTRFIVYGQTFPMQDVTSVKQDRISPSHLFAIVLGNIGAITMISSMPIYGIAILLIAIGIGIAQKPSWVVVLDTSSGETKALWSKDKAFIDGVINALNEAIVERG